AYRGFRLMPSGQNRKPVLCASTGRDILSFPAPCFLCRLCHILRHSSRSNPVCGRKMSSVLCKIICFSSPDITIIYSHNLLFCQYTQDFCKSGTEVFQYTDAIWSSYSFRPRAVSEDWLKLFCDFSLPIKNACSPSEGRVGRNCMRTNGIVCYMRNLLSSLQILCIQTLYLLEKVRIGHIHAVTVGDDGLAVGVKSGNGKGHGDAVVHGAVDGS